MAPLARPEPVSIGGMQLMCAPDGDDVWVFFDQLCSDARINANEHWNMLSDPVYHAQFRTRTERGLRLIDYRCVPGWLNKIDLRKYTNDRQRLLALQAIQRECAEVIERHFFGHDAAAGASRSLVPRGRDRLEVIQGMLDELREQRQQVARLDARVGQAHEVALDALDVNTLRARGQYFTVLACFKLWRLSATKRAVNDAGKEVAATARREGWYDERRDAFDSEYGYVNEWPACRILRWFTDRYKLCPKQQIRDLLAAHEGNGRTPQDDGWTPFQ